MHQQTYQNRQPWSSVPEQRQNGGEVEKNGKPKSRTWSSSRIHSSSERKTHFHHKRNSKGLKKAKHVLSNAIQDVDRQQRTGGTNRRNWNQEQNSPFGPQ